MVKYDVTKPSITITTPAQDLLTNDPTPALDYLLDDTFSGVDNATLEFLVNTNPVALTTDVTKAGGANLDDGLNTLVINVSDVAGNPQTLSRSFV